MSMMKRHYEDKQAEFAKYTFMKDGCPEHEAEKESFDSMVVQFFDGDYDVAEEEFEIWLNQDN